MHTQCEILLKLITSEPNLLESFNHTLLSCISRVRLGHAIHTFFGTHKVTTQQHE